MRRRLIALVLAVVALAPASVDAQSALEVPVQFDFLNPGARSLALGGAFVGVADDATAALVNPAGLVELTRPEASVEGRLRRFVQPMLVAGRLSGQPSGQGEDTLRGPIFEDISNWWLSPSFVAYVQPRGRWRFAGFRHDLIHVEQDFSSRGLFQDQGLETRGTALSARRTIAVSTYGGALAVQLPRVRLGAGLLAQHFTLGLDFTRYLHQSFYGAPDPRQRIFQFTQSGDDVGIGAVVSAMVPLPRANVGIAFKRGARFDVNSFSGGLAGSQQRKTSTFKVPDTLAAGVSSYVTQRLLLTGEYTFVRHSQLLDDYVLAMVREGETGPRASRFSIANAHEVHAGAEYLLPFRGRPALRGGFWFDPDHSVRYAPTAARDLIDERLTASLSSGRHLWHYSLGTMVAVSPRLDISAALDRSSRTTLVSSSLIFRF